MKAINTLLFSIAISTSALAQNVSIPDANFKAALVGNNSINTNSDTEIQVSEATVYTGSIIVDSDNISDLTGIGAFVNITKLYCGSNHLTNLNISACIMLTDLYCSNNNLSNLDVSSNSSLKNLGCGGNQITSLNFSSNPSMVNLSCNDNKLAFLNIKNGYSANIYFLNAHNNPNLTCILVDNVSWANTHWSGSVDNTASFSTSCAASIYETLTSAPISISPNPATNSISIQNSSIATPATLKIYNTFGEEIMNEKITNSSQPISIVHLQSGVYFVCLTTSDGTTSRKFIKQ